MCLSIKKRTVRRQLPAASTFKASKKVNKIGNSIDGYLTREKKNAFVSSLLGSVLNDESAKKSAEAVSRELSALVGKFGVEQLFYKWQECAEQGSGGNVAKAFVQNDDPVTGGATESQKPGVDVEKGTKPAADAKDAKPAADTKDAKPAADTKDAKPAADTKGSSSAADAKDAKPTADTTEAQPDTKSKKSDESLTDKYCRLLGAIEQLLKSMSSKEQSMIQTIISGFVPFSRGMDEFTKMDETQHNLTFAQKAELYRQHMMESLSSIMSETSEKVANEFGLMHMQV